MNPCTSPGRLATLFKALYAACLGALVGSAAAQDMPQQLPVITLQAGMYNVRAEVARTDGQRQIGLMFRREMAAHQGMLFIYDDKGSLCFWMKNTLIPLSIAFLADDGTVVNIADMQPGTLNSHCSALPVRYALEMNQGWFANRGIKPGFRLAGAPFAKR